MARIYDAGRECCFNGRNIMLDTNIWISIYGNDPRTERSIYSNYYSDALKKGNNIVINDYIISEYFNRACKLEYEIMYEDKDYSKFKKRRLSNDFKERMQSVQDTCLNILDDCDFVELFLDKATISASLIDASSGIIDYTDSVLSHQCVSNGFVFVSHDRDFVVKDIDFVTANEKVIRGIKKGIRR